jgi:hypothetical protein
MLIREKNGSLTVNVNGGKVTMSTRSYGMMGKTYKTAQEAFKDAEYYVAIQRPEKSEQGVFWGFVGALLIVAIFGYGFFLTINRF